MWMEGGKMTIELYIEIPQIYEGIMFGDLIIEKEESNDTERS